MANDYPIRFTAQLRQHLRALRKRRGLTQAQLGALVGVSQARIAEIEANPGLVSFEQLIQLFSALGVIVSLCEAPPMVGGTDQRRKAVEALGATERLQKDLAALGGVDQMHKDLAALNATEQLRKDLEALGGVEQMRKDLDRMKEFTSLRNFFAHSKKGSW